MAGVLLLFAAVVVGEWSIILKTFFFSQRPTFAIFRCFSS